MRRVPWPREQAVSTPEGRLWGAVLLHALEDLRGDRQVPADDRTSARAWIRGAACGGVSFEEACAAAGVDAEALRDHLARGFWLRPHAQHAGAGARPKPRFIQVPC